MDLRDTNLELTWIGTFNIDHVCGNSYRRAICSEISICLQRVGYCKKSFQSCLYFLFCETGT